MGGFKFGSKATSSKIEVADAFAGVVTTEAKKSEHRVSTDEMSAIFRDFVKTADMKMIAGTGIVKRNEISARCEDSEGATGWVNVSIYGVVKIAGQKLVRDGKGGFKPLEIEVKDEAFV